MTVPNSVDIGLPATQMQAQPLRILSLGAGVQSSTLALMAAKGEVEPFSAAIFADTQNEPAAVMTWLSYLEQEIAKLPYAFPVYRVTAGNLASAMLRLRTSQKTGNRYVKTLIPAYVDKGGGKKALFGRRCTADYKVRVLRKMQRKLAAVPRGCKDVRVHVVIGISLDEYIRMKMNPDPWAQNVYPLVDLRMTRHDCLNWMARNGYPYPPKSACLFCPFHSDAEWKRLRDDEPDDFQKAVDVDRQLRELARQQTGTARSPGDVFLHSSLQPLDEVDFGMTKSHLQVDMFGNDCTGLCGV